jgi:Uma2 family endonuclease
MALITGAFSACAESDIDYPDSDGRPVAETPIHRDNLFGMVFQLQRWFADDPMVYVSGNMFVYYEQGQPSKTVAPDVFVVIGVPRDKPRRSYKVWEEDGHAPDLVIEVTSRSTKTEDQRDKFAFIAIRCWCESIFCSIRMPNISSRRCGDTGCWRENTSPSTP